MDVRKRDVARGPSQVVGFAPWFRVAMGETIPIVALVATG